MLNLKMNYQNLKHLNQHHVLDHVQHREKNYPMTLNGKSDNFLFQKYLKFPL